MEVATRVIPVQNVNPHCYSKIIVAFKLALLVIILQLYLVVALSVVLLNSIQFLKITAVHLVFRPVSLVLVSKTV